MKCGGNEGKEELGWTGSGGEVEKHEFNHNGSPTKLSNCHTTVRRRGSRGKVRIRGFN